MPLTSCYGVASYGSAITLERGGNVFLAWNTRDHKRLHRRRPAGLQAV